MGLSTVGLLHYTTGFRSNVVEQVQQRDNEVLISRQAINRLKALLVEKTTKEDGGIALQNTYGICSLLESPGISVGAEAIFLNFKYVNTKGINWNKSRWQVIFAAPDWEFADAASCQRIDDSFTASVFARCLEYKGDSSGAWQTFVIAKIRPEYFPGGKIIDIKDKSIDPKSVMFILTAKTGSFYVGTPSAENSQEESEEVQQDIVYFHQTSDMLWANSVGECHVQTRDDKEWTTVHFSGSGTGSNSNNRVINDSAFHDTHNCEALEIPDDSINDGVVQAGQLAGQSNTFNLSSIIGLNVKLSCTAKTFRCKKSGGIPAFENKDIDPFRFTFKVRNRHPYPITLTAINITLKKKNSGEVDGTANRRLDGVSMNLYDSADSVTPIMAANIDDEENKYEINGEKEFAVEADGVQMDNHCRSICQKNSDFYPVIDVDTDYDTDGSCFRKDFSDDESNKVHCTVCYMKSCQRSGLGTFGPLQPRAFDKERSSVQLTGVDIKQQQFQGLPDEALDSQLPECHITQSYKGSDLPTKALETVSNGSDDCLAVSVSSVNDFKDLHSRPYHRSSCKTTKPVLCFINGHYVPAVEIVGSDPDQLKMIIKKTTFANAQQACFEMGREIGSMSSLTTMFHSAYEAEDSLKEQLAKIQNELVFASDKEKFDFINNATRGLFLAPVKRTYSVIPNGLVHYMVNKVVKDYSSMWTAIEMDGGGSPVASVPWAGVASRALKKDQPWAVFFNKDGARPVLFKETSQLQDSSKHFALHYNLRWKGAAPQSSTTDARFVCLNPTNQKYVVTSDTGTLEEGASVCAREGNLFIPPFSGDDWAQAMLSLNPNDEMYPFPDPKLSDATQKAFVYSHSLEDPVAWLALESTLSKQAGDSVPKASELNFYVSRWSNGANVLSKSILKTRSTFTKTGITLDGVPRGTCDDAGDTLLSLCVSRQAGGFSPVAIVPESSTSSCPSGSLKASDAKVANKFFKPQSYRYMAKLYQLLDKKRKDYRSKKPKEVIIVINAKKSKGCTKQCKETKSHYVSYIVSGSKPPETQYRWDKVSSNSVKCPKSPPDNDRDSFKGSSTRSCGSSCRIVTTREFPPL